MKVLSVVLIASVLVVSQQQGMQQVLKEWRKLVSPFLNQCMCRSGASSDLVENFLQYGELSNNPCFKCNLRCWGEQVGVFTRTGSVNVTRLTTVFGVTDEIAKTCTTSQSRDLCEKAYQIATCTANRVFSAKPANVEPATYAPATYPINKWNHLVQVYG